MSGVNLRRRYRSHLRAEQARSTRERIVTTARELFIGRGYAATSVSAIADAADVATETVYDVFGNKRAVLEAVVATGITGGIDEPDDWLQHSWAKDLLRLDDPGERLRGWVRRTAETVARTSPVHAVIRAAAASDPELAELHRRLHESRFAAQRQVIGPLLGRKVSDVEADTFSALTSPELHHLLTTTRGWSQERYQTWLENTVEASVLAKDFKVSQ